MAFQDKIEIIIDSIFDDSGFESFRSSVNRLQKRVSKLNTVFRNARGIENFTEDARELEQQLERVGLKFREVEDKQEALDKMDMRFREATQQTVERAADRGFFFEDRATGRPVPETQATQRLANVNRGLPQALNNIRETNPALAKLRENTSNVNNAFNNFGLELQQSNERLNEGQGQVRGFRFELLGLMFAGMALQRVMFGLLRPAFEAAGVFKLISSILQFLFLPVALDVLDILVSNQDAIFGLGESTRRIIGYLVAAAGILGTLAFVGGQAGLALDSLTIFLAKGSTAAKLMTGTVSTLGKVLKGLSGIRSLQGLKMTLQGLAKGTMFSKISAGISTVVSGISSFIGSITSLLPGVQAISVGLSGVLSFLGGIAAGFLAVVTVAKRFGKKVALVFGTVLAAIGLVVAAIVGAPIAIAAAIGVAIGAILGLAWTFKNQLWQVVVGTVDAIVGAIVALVKGIISVIKGVINVIQGVVTALVALILGDMKKFNKALGEIWKGLGQMFVKPFMILVDFVMNKVINPIISAFQDFYHWIVGGSLIPKLVKEIISWFWRLVQFISLLPSKMLSLAVDMGKALLKGIVNGIKAISGVVMDALKSILPDWAVKILEKGAKQIGGVVDEAGNLIGGTASFMEDVASGAVKFAGDITSGAMDSLGDAGRGLGRMLSGGGTQKNQTTIINQDIDARSQNPQESPQSRARRTGREAERGARNALNRTAGGR